MGIPPDPYPHEIEGTTYAGRTSFDKSSSPRNRSAEIRGREGQDVTSVHIAVIPLPTRSCENPIQCGRQLRAADRRSR